MSTIEPTYQKGYEWVDRKVTEYFTQYRWLSMITTFVDSVTVPKMDVEDNIILVGYCIGVDSVCHSRLGSEAPFFYVYSSSFFTDLNITFPFDEFTMSVLQMLNVALTQLHPNSWAALQAFRLVCDLFCVHPSP